jgi:prepilin-type N-terminal cleavage/methylation domain-containing protein
MTRKLKAFTLIEMMIAITVFAIGVLAVLRVVMQDLVSMDRAQIRTMAAFLAKE